MELSKRLEELERRIEHLELVAHPPIDWSNKIESLEGAYEYIENPKVIHFTNGGPWHETWDGDYKNKWIKQYEELI